MGKQVDEGDWAICPECDKKVKADNLGKHMKKVHGIKDAPLPSRPKAPRPPPFPLGKAIAAVVVIGIIISVAIILATKPPPTKPAPTISIDPSTGDFGMLQKGQKATREFAIFNYGEAPLNIKKVVTSCDCTTLTITYDNKTSPVLKMSNNPDYSVTIAPGRNAKMVITIDSSMFSQTGPIYRTVYISSNDPANKDLELTLTVHVTP